MKTTAICVLLFFVYAISLGITAAPLPRAALCKVYSKQVDSDAPQPLAKTPLTKSEKDEISRTRACVKSYSSNFPGGEDAFLKARPADILRDLNLVEQLFRSTPLGANIPRSDPQWQRKYEIANGWDKQQVLLWGNFFYVRALYKSGKYAEVIARIGELRKVYELKTVNPTAWDVMEDNTYFSVQTLRNILVSLEYAARAELATGQEVAKLADEYQKIRPALIHYFRYGADATSTIFEAYCN